MARMEHERENRRHPLIAEAEALLTAKAISRRGFMRAATLLGASVAAAGYAAHRVLGPEPATATPLETDAIARGPRSGGVLTCAMPVYEARDPARFDWVEMSNLTRHQHEQLAVTGPDNLTRPLLARAWSASEDLKTWTFTLREGVFWHNGDALTAEHVAFNFERWLDPAVGSPNRALFSSLLQMEPGAAGAPARLARGAVEVVDAATFRLHLARPALSVPESLANYPAALVHPSFNGDVAAEKNGTGPYQIVELIPGERCLLKRAAPDGWRYWGAASGGGAATGPGYVDEIHYRHFDPTDFSAVDAVLKGDVDVSHDVGVEGVDRARPAEATGDVRVLFADTAQTGCIRMRLDAEPFTDIRVRRAIQLSAEPSIYPDLLFAGRGRPGEHHHVSPIHPDYHPLPPMTRDVAAARRLLAEAGFADGLDLTLDVGNTGGLWQQRAAEALRDQVAEAGVRIAVNVMAPEDYQKIWTTTPFGLTQWVHRPLGTMALALGYRSDAPWNETGYANPAFDEALAAAEAVLDLPDRRRAMEPVERMLQEDAVMVQPVWVPIFALARGRVRGLRASPTLQHDFNAVWLDA